MSRCVNTVRLKNIKNKIMKNEIVLKILCQFRANEIDIVEAHSEILSLMGEKEIGGSGATPSNGDLHGVRECNVSGENSDKEAPINGSLEKITKARKLCKRCEDTGFYHGGYYGAELIHCTCGAK